MTEEPEPPLAFERRLVPGPALTVGRAIKHWRSRGPRLGSYAPISTLELPANIRPQACVPAINFHTHVGRWLSNKGAWMETDVGQLLDLMTACNLASLVNLDGRWGRELEDNLDRYDRAHSGRFFTFCHLDWRQLDQRNGPELLVKSLQRSVAAGARGLKVWKDLGTTVEARGRRVLPDDPILAAVWEAAADLRIPVLVHVADPVAFFRPVDHHNERLEELLRNPRNSRATGGMKEFHELVDSLERVVADHSRTTIVAAHAFYAENLARVSTMLDRYTNFFIDLAWAHVQLGRQPRAARALILAHPDRVLFGTDVFPLRPGIPPIYFRFLETEDEAFSYTDEPIPGSGRWDISGLALPQAVLEQVYRTNASRLLGLDSEGAFCQTCD